MNKTCIVIVGPTAVGKTAIALDTALHFQTAIISADSRQCFKELNIGVAKPTADELQQVTHHFISSHSIHDDMNTGVFEQYALGRLDAVFKENDIAVVVGGTGLYVKTFCHGIDDMPVVDENIRKKINQEFEWEGLEWLQKEVEKNDPLFYAQGEIKNPHRLLRALEVKLSTGRSIIEFRTQQKKQREFNIIKIGLELPKELLHKNINRRVDAMMKAGLAEEVKELLPFKKLNALQTVGYRELFGYHAGDLSLADAVEIIKINTRQYAKRQMTWFKKDEEVIWCEPDLGKVMREIETQMTQIGTD